MNKIKVKKKLIIFLISGLILGGTVFFTYSYNNIKMYKNFISSANRCMDSQEYEKAIFLFEESLKYKEDPNIRRSILVAKNLEINKRYYDDGLKLFDDKKYLEAIEIFNKVTKEDKELYKLVETKIEECRVQYISQNYKLATDAYKNKKYEEANKYLDNIFEIESKNSKAIALKNDISKAVEKQKKDAIEQKKIEEQSKKTKIITLEEAINIAKKDTNMYDLIYSGEMCDGIGAPGSEGKISKDDYEINVLYTTVTGVNKLSYVYYINSKTGKIDYIFK